MHTPSSSTWKISQASQVIKRIAEIKVTTLKRKGRQRRRKLIETKIILPWSKVTTSTTISRSHGTSCNEQQRQVARETGIMVFKSCVWNANWSQKKSYESWENKTMVFKLHRSRHPFGRKMHLIFTSFSRLPSSIFFRNHFKRFFLTLSFLVTSFTRFTLATGFWQPSRGEKTCWAELLTFISISGFPCCLFFFFPLLLLRVASWLDPSRVLLSPGIPIQLRGDWERLKTSGQLAQVWWWHKRRRRRRWCHRMRPRRRMARILTPCLPSGNGTETGLKNKMVPLPQVMFGTFVRHLDFESASPFISSAWGDCPRTKDIFQMLWIVFSVDSEAFSSVRTSVCPTVCTCLSVSGKAKQRRPEQAVISQIRAKPD